MKEGDGRNVKEEDWSGNVRGREKGGREGEKSRKGMMRERQMRER